MILRFYNKNEIHLPEFTSGSSSTRHTESNYLDVFRGDFLKKDNSLLKKRRQHLKACYNLKQIIEEKGKIRSYSELLGGIGIKAALFCEKEVEIHLNELNSVCAEVLKLNFKEQNITQGDAFEYKFDRTYQLSVIDFNNLTLKRFSEGWKELVNNVAKHTEEYFILNDCSVSHINRGLTAAMETYTRIFCAEVKTKDDYYKELKKYYEKEIPGWQMVNIQHCGQTDFILFKKTDKGVKLVRHKIIDEELKEPIMYVEEDFFT